MFTKTFGSGPEARACEEFLRERGLEPSLVAAPAPERAWFLRVDDSTLTTEARQAFLDFMYRQATARQDYLAKRQSEFEQLHLSALGALWATPEASDPDVLERLRQVIRRKRGIDGRDKALPAVCPQCHMVGDTCTCTRSWF